MKIKVSIFMCLFLVFSLLVTAGCGSQSPAPAKQEDPKPIVIKFATSGPEEHQYTVGIRKFEQIINEKSGGKIKIEVYPNSQLGGEREMIEGVKTGTIQMTTVTSDGALPAWVPETQIFTLPYLFRDREHIYKALDGELGKVLAEKCAAQGFKQFGFIELGFRHFTNNVREIKEPADMKNLKIRVQEAPIWFALIKTLGATPTPIPFNELYSALQQGVVDGQENPLGTIQSMKFYEVQKYLTLDGHTYAPGSVLMNLKFYESLSDENKKLIQDAVNEMVTYQRKYVQDKEEEYKKLLRDQGMIITEPDRQKFMDATKDIPNMEEVKKFVPAELVELARSIK